MTEWNLNQNNQKYFDSESDPRLLEDFDTAAASNYGFMISGSAKESHDEDRLSTDSILKSGSQDAGSSLKRLKTVLATDEVWPVEGGKASDISQVREAIDAIPLSFQRDRSDSSSM